MANKTSQTKPKRLSKSQRKHVRRSKQAARNAGMAPPQRLVGRVQRECPSRKTSASPW